LAKENPASIRIWNRTPERAVILSDLINNYMDSVRAVPVIDIPSDVDLIINTTPLGMWPRVEGNPLQGIELRKGTIVYDIVYNPTKTAMLQYAENQGCITVGGIGMLVGQALRAIEIWIGSKLPDDSNDIMLEAVSIE
jgi:shikimate dehydrogenase